MRPAPLSDPIRVMLIDDSAAVRAAFAGLIAQDPALALVDTAADPFEAAAKMRHQLPDVLLLDLHMPRMDGLTFLRKIMAQRPLPVVVISSFAREGSEASMRALELGAVEVLAKPAMATEQDRHDAAMRLSDVIRAAAQSRRTRRPIVASRAPGPRFGPDAILPAPRSALRAPGPALIAIGASTGGTEALKTILDKLPARLPPIVVVQHMPEAFTRTFAERLDRSSALLVREAREGDVLAPGQALIARGDRHLLVHRRGESYRVELRDGPCVARHRPSVDVLFRSVAGAAGAGALGVILTGMGDDGAQGMEEMRATGALTLAQDEASCIVYGMPRVALERGAAMRAVALDRIAQEICLWSTETMKARVR